MAKKHPLSADDTGREGFWSGFSGKRAAEAQVTQAAETQAVAEDDEQEHVGLQPGEWSGVRASLKKALSAPAPKRRAQPARAWTAATAKEEKDLEWTASDEARLRELEKPELGSEGEQTAWARSVARAQRPGARRHAPSLWSLVRALFQRQEHEPPTGQ